MLFIQTYTIKLFENTPNDSDFNFFFRKSRPYNFFFLLFSLFLKKERLFRESLGGLEGWVFLFY